jgi:hypothetical protein
MNLKNRFSCNFTGVYTDFFNEGFLSLKDLNYLFGIENQVVIEKYLDDVVFTNYPNIANKKKALIADFKVIRKFQAESSIFYFKNTNTEGVSVFFYPIRSNGQDEYLFSEGVENDERFYSLVEEESKYIMLNLLEINMKRDKPNIAYFNCLGNRFIEEHPLTAQAFKDLFVTDDNEIQKRKQKQKAVQDKFLANIGELNALQPPSMMDFCNFFITKGYVICLQSESFSVFDLQENINLTLHEYMFNEELEPFTAEKLLNMLQSNHKLRQERFFYDSMLNKKIENIINEPTNYYQLTAPVRPNNEEEVNHPSTVVAETTVAIEEVDLNPSSPIIAVQETTAPIEESIEELTQITLIMKQIENLLNPQQLKQISKMNVNDKIAFFREIHFETEEENQIVENQIIKLEKLTEVLKMKIFETRKKKLTDNLQDDKQKEHLVEEHSSSEDPKELDS